MDIKAEGHLAVWGVFVRTADSSLAFKAYLVAMKVAASFSTRLAGLVAARLWFTPWRVDPGERGRRRQTDWLADTKPVCFVTASGSLAGFAAGSGPAIVLIHGWGERAASLGALIAPLTAAGFRVTGIDLPGHGDSVAAQPNAYVIANAIREVTQKLGGVQAVVAHSLGAHATMVALRDGLDVASVVLISPSSRLDHALDRFEDMLALPPRAKRGLKLTIERRFGENVWDDLAGSNLIRDVNVPALIIHDREDPQVALEDSELLADAWSGARLLTTETLGHGRILRDEHVIDETVAFLVKTASAK